MSAQSSGGTALTQFHDLLLESEDIAGFLSEFTTVLAHRLSTKGANHAHTWSGRLRTSSL